jgi:hypothetical protein
MVLAPMWLAASGGCNADLAKLDPCHQLAKALCDRIARCSPPDARAACADDLEQQCAAANHAGDQGNANACSEDLGGACGPELPASCSDLEAALGCDSCTTTAPSEAARTACCQVNDYSSVCLGCF